MRSRFESVPLDVTLFMDTSGSTAGALDRMKRNVVTIAGMLRPDDRFRLAVRTFVQILDEFRQAACCATLL